MWLCLSHGPLGRLVGWLVEDEGWELLGATETVWGQAGCAGLPERQHGFCVRV